MRQQNAQHNGNQPGTSMRKPSQRTQKRAVMATEYQERFLPPCCYTTVVSETNTGPYRALKNTKYDVTTFKSYFVTNKWMKNPPKAPQPSVPPIGHRRCSAPHNPLRYVENKQAPKVEKYTSVYKADFQAWKTNRRQPLKLKDSLKVNHGLVVTNTASKEGRPQKSSVQVADNSKEVQQVQEPQPFQCITSYRSDYVTPPVQPRTRRDKPLYQPNKDLLSEPEVPLKPKVTSDINKKPFDEASEVFQQFKTWSLETKPHGQGKAKELSPPADHNKFLSTTHAEYTAHECQRTKPVLPPMQTREQAKRPFEATTTMKEDYKAWDTPPHFPTGRKEKLDRPKKTTFSVCTRKLPVSCKTNPKPLSPQPKLDENAVCCSSCNATEKPQCPAENGAFSGFECIPNGTEESRRYWTTSMDRGTWANVDICEGPSEAHQIISCMVSSRS